MYEEERVKEMKILVADQARYEMLVRGLINNSKLSYDKNELIFDDDFIRSFIKAVYPMDYKERFESLRKEEEAEDE